MDNSNILNKSVCDEDVDIEQIMELLPPWKTHILEANIIDKKDFPKLSLRFLLDAHTKSDIEKWLDQLQESNKTTYSIHCTTNTVGRYLNFKQRLICQHNTRSKNVYDPSVRSRTSTKNTNCPSKINIVLHAVKKRYQGKDKEKHALIREMPCEVTYIATHNHTIPDTLRFRKMGAEAKEKLLSLFHNGHTPSTALELLKIDIQINNVNYEEILADRKYCPSYDDCYHLYRREFDKKNGPWEFSVAAQDFLKENLEKYNQETKDNSAKMIYFGSDYVICLCPPLFKRVHEHISASSEIVYIDSTGTVNHDSSRVFILLTHSDCGGLPLGIIITSCESTDIISLGFQLLQEMVGDKIFGGKVEGPAVFITDDSSAELAALKTVWPKSRNLLCTFHVLQSVWKWLMRSKNGVPQKKQAFFYNQFRAILHARTETDCLSKFEEAKRQAMHYPNYEKYLLEYWSRRELWAKAYRNNLTITGNHTNNYSEAAMRILKTKIFNRVKTFNVVQMVDFLITKLVSYYKLRLLDAALNRPRRNIFADAIRAPPPGLLERIQILNDDLILVPSESDKNLFYTINMEVLICGCSKGNTGGGCKHVDWANMLVNSENSAIKLDNFDTRKLMYFIASGRVPPDHWLEPLSLKINDCDSNLPFEIETANESDTDIHVAVSDIDELETVDAEFDGPTSNISQEEIAKESAKATLVNINNILTEFIDRSPIEVNDGLDAFYATLQKIKNPSTLTSCCINFGSGIRKKNRGNYIGVQPTAISLRKINLGKKSHVRGRRRKDSNNSNAKKKSVGHNLSIKVLCTNKF